MGHKSDASPIWFGLFTAGILLCLTSIGSAEGVKSETLYELSLTDLLSVQISGVSLREQQVLDSPASINVFDHRAIDKLGVTTLIELLRFVPGFQSYRADDANNQSVAARGRSGAAASREVLLIIDGVRIDSWWLGASIFNISPVSLAGVKKVEFIRGPVSQIYGSNAVTGVINIETGRDQNSVTIEAGNLEHVRFSTSLHFQKDEHQHFFTLDVFNEGGEDYFVADPFGSDERLPIADPRDYLSLGYRWRSPNWSAQLMLIENRTEDFFSGGGVNELYNSVDVSHYHVNLKHTNGWQSGLSTHLSLGYRTLVNEFEVPFSGDSPFAGLSDPPSDAPLVGFADEDTFEYWIDGHLLQQSHRDLDVQVGFEIRYRGLEDVVGMMNYDLDAVFNGEFPVASSSRAEFPVLVTEGASEFQWGLFTTLTYGLGKAELNLGGRFDDYEIVGTQFTPRASVVYKLTAEHALKLIYGEAFRSPANVELFAQNNLNIIGSPDIAPEVVNTLEAIWHHETEARRLQLGWFYNQFEDTIGVNITQEGLREFVNLGESHSQGVEFSWTESLSEHLAARVVASDLIHKPEDMFRLADETANAVLSYWRNPWTLTADVVYNGERAYVHTEGDIRSLESYTLFNLHVNFALNSDADLSLTALNVFDQTYEGPPEARSPEGIPARGIEVKVGMEYRF